MTLEQNRYPFPARLQESLSSDGPVERYAESTVDEVCGCTRWRYRESDRTRFRVAQSTTSGNQQQLTYDATVRDVHVAITYSLDPDSYVVRIQGQVDGSAKQVYLLTQLPTTLRPAESDTVGDLRNLAFSFKSTRENARIVPFGKLDPGEQKLEPGPLTWAAVKNKYFVFGLLNPAGSSFNEMTLKGGARTSKLATNASATIVKAVSNGTFAMDLYAGPQQSTQLIALGRDFDHVNPYGWRILQGVVQPIAALCIRLLLWMHQSLQAELRLGAGNLWRPHPYYSVAAQPERNALEHENAGDSAEAC